MRVNNKYYQTLNKSLKANIRNTRAWLDSGEAIKFFMQRRDNLNSFLEDSELYATFRNNTKSCYENADEIIEDFYHKGSKEGYREIREDRVFTSRDRKTLNHLKDYNYKLIKGINNDHRIAISDTLINGVIEGKNPKVVAKELESTANLPVRNGISPRARANMVARTETSRALNEGNKNAYKNYGYTEVVWITAGDENVCSDCENNEGKTFSIDEVEIPLHPNCRCALRAKVIGK